MNYSSAEIQAGRGLVDTADLWGKERHPSWLVLSVFFSVAGGKKGMREIHADQPSRGGFHTSRNLDGRSENSNMDISFLLICSVGPVSSTPSGTFEQLVD